MRSYSVAVFPLRVLFLLVFMASGYAVSFAQNTESSTEVGEIGDVSDEAATDEEENRHEHLNTEERRGELILIVGSSGTSEYAVLFEDWANRWCRSAKTGHVQTYPFGMNDSPAPTTENLKSQLDALQADGEEPLWIVLIGHGTFDGRTAKFNLEGPDLTAEEMGDLLANVTRPVAFINCTSASAPFLSAVTQRVPTSATNQGGATNRVIITATSSPNEINFSRFGGYMAEAISDPRADLDKDDQTSLLEAFLLASRRTLDFYEAEGRIATEYAILDDNGDQRPVPIEGFDGTQPINRQESPNSLPDGVLAGQWHLIPSPADAELSPEVITRRNQLEREIALIRNRKADLAEEQYYNLLEPLFLEMAQLLVVEAASESSTPVESVDEEPVDEESDEEAANVVPAATPE